LYWEDPKLIFRTVIENKAMMIMVIMMMMMSMMMMMMSMMLMMMSMIMMMIVHS
tara:strand:+ start:1437 stop:1598 length:162 start_codon:yes stop_codon:yes gene_type:complete